MSDGILNLNKPGGMTSHDCLYRLRRIFPDQKMGHIGTLDPDATGVLVVCIGKARKLVQFMIGFPKEYRGEMTLGASTDTQDASGTVINSSEDFTITLEHLKSVMQSFIGTVKQVPPMVSAVKYKGRKLYELAREGKEVEVPAREVVVYDFALEGASFSEPLGFGSKMRFFVRCSSGTYVRTLVSDLGNKLGCFAHLSALDRISVGPFHKDSSYTLEEVEEAYNAGEIDSILLPMDSGIQDMPAVYIKESAVLSVRSGASLYPQGIKSETGPIQEGDTVRIYSPSGMLLSIAKAKKDENRTVYVPVCVVMGR